MAAGAPSGVSGAAAATRTSVTAGAGAAVVFMSSGGMIL